MNVEVKEDSRYKTRAIHTSGAEIKLLDALQLIYYDPTLDFTCLYFSVHLLTFMLFNSALFCIL